ncbi:hypothetical protein A3H90_02440 [Candidatus Peribacteria bacterium RIFCSPLOWO2_02_FULL_55_36]|nr:MAG: hypothetical protein A3H90_02440 [Candidatus Peribacteria bacterium RIFCSPLOWO2_02_FULL_55_36]
MGKRQIGPIGPSAGWLAAKLAPLLAEHISILHRAQATAVEMVCHNVERTRILTREHLSPLGEILEYASIHLGSFQDFPTSPDLLTDGQRVYLRSLQQVCEWHKISAASAHPDVVPTHVYALLKECGIPVAIENMDRDKKTGQTPDIIQEIGRKHHLPYVLDVQHLYEIAKDHNEDPVIFAGEFARVMGKDIEHLHVSGELVLQGKQVLNHAQLPIATNRKVVVRAVRAILDTTAKPLPIILEGEYLIDIPCDYTVRDNGEREELYVRCAEDMRKDRECLLNEI